MKKVVQESVTENRDWVDISIVIPGVPSKGTYLVCTYPKDAPAFFVNVVIRFEILV